MSKPTNYRSGCIYAIAGNYNVAQAIELSDTASVNGVPQWVMRNYDGTEFFSLASELLVASKEEIKMWCIANKQYTTDSKFVREAALATA